MLDHDLGHLCRGRRIQKSGHSVLGSFSTVGASSTLTWVDADTASLTCPAHPGSLAITSGTFAAVICDADEPCSVDTAHEPGSCFATAPRSTTRPFHVQRMERVPGNGVKQALPCWSSPKTWDQNFVGLSVPKHSCQRISQQIPFQEYHCLNFVPQFSPLGTNPTGRAFRLMKFQQFGSVPFLTRVETDTASLVLRILTVWRSRPELLPPTFGTLTILAQ